MTAGLKGLGTEPVHPVAWFSLWSSNVRTELAMLNDVALRLFSFLYHIMCWYSMCHYAEEKMSIRSLSIEGYLGNRMIKMFVFGHHRPLRVSSKLA